MAHQFKGFIIGVILGFHIADNILFVVLYSALPKGFQCSFQTFPVILAVFIINIKGNLPVSVVCQALHCLVSRVGIVNINTGGIHIKGTVYNHHGNLPYVWFHMFYILCGCNIQYAVYKQIFKGFKILLLLFHISQCITQNQGISCLCSACLHIFYNLRIIWIHDIRYDKADQLAAAFFQAPGSQVGLIIQITDRLHHFLFCLWLYKCHA